MARPTKRGLEYFPLDVDFFSDTKIKILRAHYGADGVEVYLYLLTEIYREGYYRKVDEDFLTVMADELRMKISKVKQVLSFLLERSLFDDTLFQSDKIITSAGIQRRFQEAVKRRAMKNPIVTESFWILSEKETQSFIKVTHSKSYSQNNPDNSQNNPGYSQNNDTKESRVKESKVKESRVESTTLSQTDFLRPTLREVEAYCKERSSLVNPERFYDYYEASGWIDKNGEPVKNWRQTLIGWEGIEKNQKSKEQPVIDMADDDYSF